MVKKSNKVEQDLIEPPKYTQPHPQESNTLSGQMLDKSGQNLACKLHVSMNVITFPCLWLWV